MSEDSAASSPLTPCQRQWLEHLETWQAQEELSLKEYARTRGLSVSALYTAKRWFKSRGIWRGRERGARKRSRPRLNVVPVRVSPVAAPIMSSSVRVHLPNGIVLEVPEHAEPARCRALIGALLERRS